MTVPGSTLDNKAVLAFNFRRKVWREVKRVGWEIVGPVEGKVERRGWTDQPGEVMDGSGQGWKVGEVRSRPV